MQLIKIVKINILFHKNLSKLIKVLFEFFKVGFKNQNWFIFLETGFGFLKPFFFIKPVLQK